MKFSLRHSNVDDSTNTVDSLDEVDWELCIHLDLNYHAETCDDLDEYVSELYSKLDEYSYDGTVSVLVNNYQLICSDFLDTNDIELLRNLSEGSSYFRTLQQIRTALINTGFKIHSITINDPHYVIVFGI